MRRILFLLLMLSAVLSALARDDVTMLARMFITACAFAFQTEAQIVGNDYDSPMFYNNIKTIQLI